MAYVFVDFRALFKWHSKIRNTYFIICLMTLKNLAPMLHSIQPVVSQSYAKFLNVNSSAKVDIALYLS